MHAGNSYERVVAQLFFEVNITSLGRFPKSWGEMIQFDEHIFQRGDLTTKYIVLSCMFFDVWGSQIQSVAPQLTGWGGYLKAITMP